MTTSATPTPPARRSKSRKARRAGCIVTVPGKHGNSFRLRFDIPGGIGGKRNTVTRTFRSREDADRELRRLQDQAEAGVRLTETLTLRQWAEKWLDETMPSQVSGRTLERYGELLRLHVLPTLGAIGLRKLRTGDIEGLYNTLALSGKRVAKGKEPAGLSLQTVTHVHRVLSQCLKDAVRLQHLGANPATVVKRPKLVQEEDDTPGPEGEVPDSMNILSHEDMAKLLAGVASRDGEVKSIPYALVRLALDSGARRGEILALRWRDIDTAARTIRIDRAVEETKAKGIRIKNRPKNHYSRRTVTISASTVAVLTAEWKRQAENLLKVGKKHEPEALAFPLDQIQQPTAPLRPREVTKAFGRMATKLGVENFSLHDLRHCCASYALAAGRPITEVSKHLGHANPEITLRIYSHAIPKKERGAGLLDELGFGDAG